jgi:hypothetical protein
VARLLTRHGFIVARDVELVAYREGTEPMIYHFVVAGSAISKV